jgi:hypothetical protein
MSRNLKRVPLKFDAPLKEIWKGYKNPYTRFSGPCIVCDGDGQSFRMRELHRMWYGSIYPEIHFDPASTGSAPLTPEHPGVRAFAERQCRNTPDYYGSGGRAIVNEAIRLCGLWNASWSHHLSQEDVDALIAADRLWDFTRRPKTEADKLKPQHPNGWMKEDNGYRPTAKEVNDWSLNSFAHDSINSWTVCKAKMLREGYTVAEMSCPACKGDGTVWKSRYYKRKAETWKAQDPPRGKGYQLWEDVSEGSPVSPVFRTLEELCAWCETGATTLAPNALRRKSGW